MTSSSPPVAEIVERLRKLAAACDPIDADTRAADSSLFLARAPAALHEAASALLALEGERDALRRQASTDMDVLMASIDEHTKLEDEILACETDELFWLLQARLRQRRAADIAATKATVEKALVGRKGAQ
jgi:hypothetical protein